MMLMSYEPSQKHVGAGNIPNFFKSRNFQRIYTYLRRSALWVSKTGQKLVQLITDMQFASAMVPQCFMHFSGIMSLCRKKTPNSIFD